MNMQSIIRTIHEMPEDIRKLLAGIAMAATVLVFFGVWTSFMSSHLVALSPGAGPSTETDRAAALGQYPLPVEAAARVPAGGDEIAGETTVADADVFTPGEGVREAFRDAGQTILGTGNGESRGFVVSLMSGVKAVAGGIGSLSASIIQGAYRALSRHVPPNL